MQLVRKNREVYIPSIIQDLRIIDFYCNRFANSCNSVRIIKAHPHSLECQFLADKEVLISDFLDTLKKHDRLTFQHSIRSALYVDFFTKSLDIDEEAADKIRIACILHDVGKVLVDNSILQKNGPLTEEEYAGIKQHSILGAKIIEACGVFDREVVEYILYHHENINGTGYPLGLGEGKIPLGAKIIRIADAFDAMTSDRPYRSKFDTQKALLDLINNQFEQFDAKLVRIFINSFKEDDI